MRATRIFTILLIAALPLVPAQATEFATVALQLCEKVKACAIEQMNQEEMTPEIRQMLQPMLDNMCASVQSGVQEVPQGHALYPAALACMRSLAQLSCQQIQEMQDSTTPECKKYQEMAEQSAGG